MNNYFRYFLLGTIVIVSFVLWDTWQKEHPKTVSIPTPSVTQNLTPVEHSSRRLETLSTEQPISSKTHELITVTTDVLALSIDKEGGEIVKAELLQYPQSLQEKTPFQLLNDNPDTFYIADNGLLKGNDSNNAQIEELNYQTDRSSYQLSSDSSAPLIVTLKAHSKDGLEVTKTFTFRSHEYEIPVHVEIKNLSQKTWMGNYYVQISRMNQTVKRKFLSLPVFLGVAFSTPEKPYQKMTFDALAKNPLNGTTRQGWIAELEHYFLSAWVPESKAVYRYYSRIGADGVYTVGMLSESFMLSSSQNKSITSKFYVGPKLADKLDAVAPHLSLTIDYSSIPLFSLLSMMLFKLMKLIHQFIGNWGWSIVIITLLIKLAFYRLSAASYRSMASMRRLQPKIQRLKETYGTDRQAFSQALLKLYREEKVSPFGGGCLPILIQIPVFLCLYWVLMESVELRQAPFLLWIQDLSSKDPYYILPILMGLSMFVQQKLSPQPADPTQAKVMLFMPIMMTALFFNFPSGLVLYWVVNNALSIAQQWYIVEKFEKGRFQLRGKRKK